VGEHGVPAAEVGGLQLAGQRGRRVGFDSLEDSSPAEDFVHGWPPPAVESDDTLVQSGVDRANLLKSNDSVGASRIGSRSPKRPALPLSTGPSSRRHSSPGCPPRV
jgi:hypothetical protein